MREHTGDGIVRRSVVRRHDRTLSAPLTVHPTPRLSPFCDVPRSHIYAALAYYFADREAMDAELDAEQAEYDRLAEEDRRAKAAR